MRLRYNVGARDPVAEPQSTNMPFLAKLLAHVCLRSCQSAAQSLINNTLGWQCQRSPSSQFDGGAFPVNRSVGFAHPLSARVIACGDTCTSTADEVVE
jgi:hypothetical protein